MHIKKLLWVLLLFPALAMAQGISWGPRVRVDDAAGSGPHAAIHPYTIIDNSLRVYSGWEDDRDGNGRYSIYFSRSTDLAASFSANIPVIGDSLSHRYPWMTKVGSSIYLVWQALHGSNWKIYFSRSTDNGSSFTAPDTVKGVAISNSQSSAVNLGPIPKIAADPKDSVLYLVWADDAAGTTRVKCAKSTNRGDSFFGSVNVNTNLAGMARHPSIAVGDSGQVFVAYEQGGGTNQDPNPHVYYNLSADYGAAFSATALKVNDDPGPARHMNPSITRRPGEVMVIWEDARQPPAAAADRPYLFFSQKYDTAAAFSANLQVSYGSGEFNFRPRIAIDQTNGNLVVAWHSDSSGAKFELRMTAFNDSIGQFINSYKLFNTFTGTSGANFGNAFYPPALAITNIDSVTNFFMVWQDLGEDASGNIYAVRGRVVTSQVDLDVFPDALDAHGDSLDFGILPAGPAYVSRSFRLANASDAVNPDTADGPSTSRIDTLTAYPIVLKNLSDSILTGFIETPASLPALEIGQSLDVTVTLYIPEGTLSGRYEGFCNMRAVGSDLTVDTDSIRIVVQGPTAAVDLENLRVFPNPFKPYIGHTVVNFEGLTAQATVKIYDIKGRLVEEISETNGDGLATWAPKAASGVYIYSVTNPQGAKKTGKIAVIR
ncbi:T9SS type A sorting domain-containing protein [candidate division TA06 bacterium]|uniref:T9SS type A sorting domain-containing protein n=1 Tax=candidate division TA06 bacterium TaxID=2250710 RepID=A0A933I8S0_UNCT6|nr:T9SS type A sorting domain-containing protein [candidate division TA06 bacterium]